MSAGFGQVRRLFMQPHAVLSLIDRCCVTLVSTGLSLLFQSDRVGPELDRLAGLPICSELAQIDAVEKTDATHRADRFDYTSAKL
jgi:hypothetical protein